MSPLPLDNVREEKDAPDGVPRKIPLALGLSPTTVTCAESLCFSETPLALILHVCNENESLIQPLRIQNVFRVALIGELN